MRMLYFFRRYVEMNYFPGASGYFGLHQYCLRTEATLGGFASHGKIQNTVTLIS